jgi:hypothetical protein
MLSMRLCLSKWHPNRCKFDCCHKSKSDATTFDEDPLQIGIWTFNRSSSCLQCSLAYGSRFINVRLSKQASVHTRANTHTHTHTHTHTRTHTYTRTHTHTYTHTAKSTAASFASWGAQGPSPSSRSSRHKPNWLEQKLQKAFFTLVSHSMQSG